MKKILLYGHGGAYNHGAEAIVRTTVSLLRDKVRGEILLSTHFPKQDMEFGLDKLVDELIPADLSLVHSEKSASEVAEKESVAKKIYRNAISRIDGDTICIAIGGDNYCYENWHRQAVFHKTAKERGAKSILWSCSIQPEMMDERMCEVLRTHDHIYARENCTYRALLEHGVKNVSLLADPAFHLQAERVDLPEGFIQGNMVAVNLSPLVLRKEPEMMKEYLKVVRYFLAKKKTILMIPHVIMPMDNDSEALQALAKCMTAEERKHLCWIDSKLNAAQLKYLISKCEFLICSRTHASIAAYSSGVPVVVVGYSIKSKGIGMDMGMERYVIPYEDEERLLDVVGEAWEKRESIRERLAGKAIKTHSDD